MSNRLKKLKV